MTRTTLYKLLGLAGVAGVAATGVLVTRGERARAEVTPEQVRARLRERHAEAVGRQIETQPVDGAE